MNLQELMAGFTPDPAYVGNITPDDWVLAVGESSADDPGNFLVAQGNITGVDAQMNPVTQDTQYIREGQSTTKVNTQPTYKVTGDRYIGNAFQDFVLSHAMVYATGEDAVRPYVYFNVRNGAGEKGMATIIVNSPGGGSAGDTSAFDVDLKKSGKNPEAYTYTPSGETNEVAVEGISLDKTTGAMAVGDTLQLTATVSPSDATNKNVTFSSSSSTKAQVSAKGLVTAVAAGSATITATTEDGSKKATCTVTIS